MPLDDLLNFDEFFVVQTGQPGVRTSRPALTLTRSRHSMATAKLVPTTPDPAAKFARREKLRIIMKQAWAWARHGAAKFGGNVRQYLAEALRIVWAEKKKLAREIAESRARVLAEVAKMQAEGVIAPPRPVARYRTPPPGMRSFTHIARHGALGPSTVRV